MRRSNLVPGLVTCLAAFAASPYLAAEDVPAPVPEASSSATVVAQADRMAETGHHAEAIVALELWLNDHPKDQIARQHLLMIRANQKEAELREVLQQQSNHQDLIIADPDYQALRAQADEDIKKRLAVVEYFLSQNRLSEAAQTCNAILRDHPQQSAALRLKFRILNTVVERERKELLKDREYRRGEAINDVIEDGIFPRDKPRVQRQVFVFQEDIDDTERGKVRARLQEKITLNQHQAKVWDVMRTLFAVAGINYVVLDSALGDETVSLHLVDDTVESALNAVGKLAKIRFAYTDGTVFVSSDADDGLVTEIIRLRSGLTNVDAPVSGSSFGLDGASGPSGGASGGGGANGGNGLPPQVANALRQQGGGQNGGRGGGGAQGGAPGKNPANGQGSAGQGGEAKSDVEKFLEKLPEIIVGWQDTHKWYLDRKSNTVYLRASPWVIGEAKRLLHALDYNNVQVLIESRFVEVSEEALRQLGVDWGAFQGTNPASANWAGGNGSPSRPAAIVAGAASQTGGVLSGLLQQNAFTLNASLKALETEGKADSLAEPKILTLNNATGLIEITKTTTYVSGVTFQTFTNTSTGNLNNNNVISNSGQVPQPQFDQAKEGYQLNITPSVARNSDVITLKLKPTVQKLTALTNEPVFYQPSANSTDPKIFNIQKPQYATRSLETVLHVQNGRTLALGGLSDALEEKTTSGTPFIQRIPVLGYLFKTETNKSQRRNLIILVTANIVDPSGANVSDDIAHLRDSARILIPDSVAGMEPAPPVMIEAAQPAGPKAQPNPPLVKGRRP